jgi:hypothetical protein
MSAEHYAEDQAILRALREAATRFPFCCSQVHSIVAQTRYNVVARICIELDGVEMDYVLKTSLHPENSYVLQQVWAKDSQRELEQDLAGFVLPAVMVWGHGLGGVPTYLRLQPYVRGRTLKEFTYRELLQADPKLLRDLGVLCRKIIIRFLRTGAIIDTSGSFVDDKSWIKQKIRNLWLNFFFYNTTNVIIEHGTNRVLLVDTDAPKNLLGIRHARGFKRKAKVVVMFMGVLLSKMVFDTCLMSQRLTVGSNRSDA